MIHMIELHDALEDCLQALADGQELESVLGRYPGLEHELRPLLEASILAGVSRQIAIPDGVKRRGRARLLQVAAEMRDANRKPTPRMIPGFTRLALTLGLVGTLVLTSTGFVSASSGTLPGDQLYPVKRTWEGVQLFFAFNLEERDLLESQFEQERLDEIGGLLGLKKAAPIAFTGLVTRKVDDTWDVSGIPVSVSNVASSPAGVIPDGAPVMITGVTRSDGVVDAQNIQLLQPGGPLPPLGPSERGDSTPEVEQESGNPLPTPFVVVTATSSAPANLVPTQEQKTYQFSGVVQSMKNNVWIINGQNVSMDQAGDTSGIKIGSVVIFDGYYGSDGKFDVTKVEIKSGDNLNKPQKNTGGNGSGGSDSGSGYHGGSGGGDDGGGSGGSDDGSP
jgi:uncharacterized membrane protein YgcG